MDGKIVYFEKTGPENTEVALRIAKQRAEEIGIKKILVASTTGSVAIKALELLKGLDVIFVSHSTGFSEPNAQRFTKETPKIVESKHKNCHAFGLLDKFSVGSIEKTFGIE